MKRILLPLVSACVFAVACDPSSAARTNTSAGTLALTRDDALLYAVDTDSRTVRILDAKTDAVVATVAVGVEPEQILVGPDDTAWVANRGDRSVSTFRRGEWDKVERVPVGVEPVGLALTSDAKTLYVVNASSTTHPEVGSLMAIDTASKQAKWELDIGPDARSIALIGDDKAVISLFRPGDVVEVDLKNQKVLRSGSELNRQVNREPSGGDFTKEPIDGIQSVRARGISQLVVSPDGDKVFGTVTWATDAVLGGSDTGSSSGGGGGAYGGGGGCQGNGAVASPGIVTFEGRSLAPQVDPSRECFNTEVRDYPPTRLVSTTGEPIQGPTAILVDQTGSWLFVANKESNNVVVVPTTRGTGAGTSGDFFSTSASVRETVKVGAGPSGLALTSDGKRLYVHNQFDHDVSVIEQSGSSTTLAVVKTLRVASPTLPPEVEAGRKMFFAADDARMNSPAIGISCGSCHLEGREDGHVWNFTEGPRQTPSLAGRKLALTAPFHWGGEHVDFDSFLNHTVGARMGGSGVGSTAQRQLFAYIESIPTPDNPSRLSAPSDAQIRGANVFIKANCHSCHAGEALTNNTNADVGTFVQSGPVVDDPTFFAQTGGLNTPSLLGIARTAPYLHDGSAATLKERILEGKAQDRHGLTSQLTEAEVDDLVEYLKAL